MKKEYEVRMEADGSCWVNLDEIISMFESMGTDDKYLKKLGEFSAYTLSAFKHKALNEPEKIMHSKTFSGTPE